GIAIETDHLGAWNDRPHLLFDALRPHSELLDAGAATRGASLRGLRLATTAAMAHERTIRVIGVRDLARRALRDVPAVAAEHHRRETAAIQIEDGLVASGDRPLERLAQRLRQRPAIAGPELEAQVDDRRRWERQLTDTFRQREGHELALPRGLVGDHARRRAAKHDGGSGDVPELERRVDRVIARVALLLVRGL